MLKCTLVNRIKSKLRGFRRADDGSIVTETILMFPMLFGAVLMTFVFFDAFRNQSINVKANYTIGDTVSRQAGYITDNYIVNTWKLHRFLANSASLTSLRVSVIKFDAARNSHIVVWSRAQGGGSNLQNVPIGAIGLNTSEIPLMPNDEVLIVVQTSVDYEPNFGVGLGAFQFDNVSYTRPRKAPRNLCFSRDGSDANRICPIGS